jgi:uroporphyrinogen-III decarboxylase
MPKDRYHLDPIVRQEPVDEERLNAEDNMEEVRARIRIFGKGGGFISATIHNIQANTPVENLLAMLQTVRDYG